MSVARKWCVSELWLLQYTNSKPTLEVELTDQRGRLLTCTGSIGVISGGRGPDPHFLE